MKDSVDLFYREGSSDKVYKVSIIEDLSGFNVNFAYGRRGNSLTTGTKNPKPVPYDQARKIFDKLIQEKTAKGYIEDPSGKPFALTANTVNAKTDTGFRPQLLNEIEESELDFYINNSDWCAQEKYDGRRRALVIKDRVVEGTNRKGLVVPIEKKLEHEVVNNRVPELLNYVLDGEDMGDHIMIFDVPLIGVSYKDRYQKLKQMFKYKILLTVKLVSTAWTTKEKKDMLKRLKKENAEGIVFKNINAGFIPGRPSSGGDQLKFKFCATATVQVVKTHPEKRSVLVAVYDQDDHKIEVGNVTVYPNQEMPAPGEILEVKYLYYFPGGSLFQPVLLGERDDMTIEDCTLKQLKIKREEVES